jgi:hypothetical protein
MRKIGEEMEEVRFEMGCVGQVQAPKLGRVLVSGNRTKPDAETVPVSIVQQRDGL